PRHGRPRSPCPHRAGTGNGGSLRTHGCERRDASLSRIAPYDQQGRARGRPFAPAESRVSPIASEDMRVTRVYSDDRGETHLADVEIELSDAGEIGHLSRALQAKSIVFRMNKK